MHVFRSIYIYALNEFALNEFDRFSCDSVYVAYLLVTIHTRKRNLTMVIFGTKNMPLVGIKVLP